MNVSGAAQKAPRQEISTTTDILLTGRWLAFLRPTSVIIVGFTLALWMVAIPIRYAQLASVCSAVCGDQQLSRRALAHFKASGLTLGFYSAFMGTVEVLFVLAFVVVAVVILWKKSDTRIGLITALFLTTFSVSNTDSSALAVTYPVLSV